MHEYGNVLTFHTEILMFLNETLAVSGIQCLTKDRCMQRPMYMYINGREVKFKVSKNISTRTSKTLISNNFKSISKQ